MIPMFIDVLSVLPQDDFMLMPYFLGAFSLVMFVGILNMVGVRVLRPEHTVAEARSKISMGLFYWALLGYMLVVFRLSEIPVLSMYVMYLLWLSGFIMFLKKRLGKVQEAEKIVIRVNERKEEKKEQLANRDPYIAAHQKNKKKKKK